jgi:hypothetical protein
MAAKLRQYTLDANNGISTVDYIDIPAGGDVDGPASATDNNVAFFDGATGKLLKDRGLTLSGSNTGDQTSIVGITGTLAEFNTALTGADFATGGGVITGASSGTNTGDQTNITGNAATVTTNANLTGPITSTGNTTAVASQTGTGSKFVMDTSPVLVTPTLGVAAATSINFGQTDLNYYGEGTSTPTVTSSSGSFNTVSATLVYTKVGRVVNFNASVTITDNGTAASDVQITLPFTPVSPQVSSFVGRETAATGNRLWGYITGGIASAVIVNLTDGSYPGGTGRTLRVSGMFQT